MPRAQPKIYQLQIKSHKLAIMITVPPSTTIAAIKEEVLSALLSDVNQAEDVPKVTGEDDFEICRSIKGKGKSTGGYEALDVSKQVREYNLAGWDALYLQFRDLTTGNFLPVTFTQHSLEDDGEDQPPPEADYPMSSTSKGKRKAHFDD